MIKLKELSREDANKIITGYDNLDDDSFNALVERWKKLDPATDYDDSYQGLRDELVEAYNRVLEYGGNNRIDYLLDLIVGLKLYNVLSPDNGFTTIQANNDDIWRYISVKVMPDMTYLRYPDPEKAVTQTGGRLNHKRFYSHTRRIWLKSLWWYIHLSWQGSAEDTFEVLRGNTVDNINKLIETPGRGYRLPLFRAMMKEYHNTRPHVGKDFARFTKMNNAKCVLIEPALTEGGEQQYAKRLLAELAERKENNDGIN